MAKKKEPKEESDQKQKKISSRGYESGKAGATSLLDQLSTSLYGTPVRDETDDINDRFNEIMSSELNKLTNNGTNTFDSFLGQIYSSDRDKSDNVLDNIASQQLQLNTLGATNPQEFITEQYKNRMLKQADAAEISNQLIELREAKEIMRDAILSADVNSGRINRHIIFEKGTISDPEKDYTSLIEAMEKKFNTPKIIKDFIVDNTLSYGTYYVYTIPYYEVFNNFAKRFKKGNDKRFGRNRFFESVEEGRDVEDIIIRPIYEDGDSVSRGFGKRAKKDEFFEGCVEDIETVFKESGKFDHDTDHAIRDDLNTLLTDRITLSTDAIPIPILENGVEMYRDYAEEYFEDGIYEDGPQKKRKTPKSTEKKEKEKDKKKKDDKKPTKAEEKEREFLTKYSDVGSNQEVQDGFFHDTSKAEDKFTEADVKDCYIKMIPPTRMLPIQVMGESLFYLYIQTDDAVPLSTILSYTSILKEKDPMNKVNAFIDDIADRVVSKFDKAFVKDNLEFRKTIVAALEYYDLSNTKIHFQLIPKEYITEFKINVDIDGNGHSMLEPSLFYAKLYLMLLMFKIVTILTKSNDEKINYIRTSGIDKNTFNKAQEIIRQKQARKITLNDLFSYTSIVNKVGAGSEVYMPLGRNGEKPVETEILQGQEVQMSSDLMEWLRTAYILGTNVPSAIMNYLNEADFAKSIETANTKLNGRVINYQIDFNDPLSELYQKLLRYSTDMPEDVVQSVRCVLPEPKGSSNVAKQEILNNYQTLQDFLVKVYFGDNSDDQQRQQIFIKEIAKLHLPMINFAEIDEIYKESALEPKKTALSQNDDMEDLEGV